MKNETELATAVVAATLGLRGFGLHGCPEELSGPEMALLAIADPGLDCRVTIIGPGSLELACALLRRGHTDVTMVKLCERPRAGSADVVIMPEVQTVDVIAHVAAYARRTLVALGTVVIRLASDLEGASEQLARRELLRHGFALIRTRNAYGCAILRAELPLYGQVKCA